MKELKGNVNVRAAFIHIVGDLIQSIGVVIAAIIILVDQDLRIVDPICTFICSILVFFTTLPILKDCLLVLMEASPPEIDIVKLENDLRTKTGASSLHDLHVWSISVGKHSLSVHMEGDNPLIILKKATEICHKKYKILHTTIQVESTSNFQSVNHSIDCRSEIH